MQAWAARLGVRASVLAYVAASGGQAAPEPGLPSSEPEPVPVVRVVRVVDGDTVVLRMAGKDTTVRLIGVDMPETVHPSKPVEAYGKEASESTRNLLLGESVRVQYEPGPSRLDKYGRTLAYLYRAPDGLFVNAEIVRHGYGHAYPHRHRGLAQRPREPEHQRGDGHERR